MEAKPRLDSEQRDPEAVKNLDLLRSALDNLAQAISVVDKDLRLVAWNTRLFELLDFPREFGRPGKPLADFFRYNAERGEYGPGEPEEQVAQRVALTLRFEPHCFERTRPDGTTIEVRGTPLAGGGFVTTYTDVTAQKRAEEELRESAQRMRAVLDSALDCVVTMDHEGSIVEFNPAAEQTFGYRRDDVIGKPMAEVIVPPAFRESHRRGLIRYLQTGESSIVGKRIEITGMRADGTEFPVELAIARVPGAAPPLFTGWLRDITERHALEHQLRQSQKMEAIGQLAGGIAHDFNNLLTVITVRSHLLLDRLGADHPLHGNVEQIRRTSERAANLVRQLLAFARKQVLEPKVLDLNAIVTGIQGMLGPLIGEHIDVTFTPAPNLGAVRADPGQIEQVLVNLALNARDAMPKGGRLILESANVEIDAAFMRQNAGAQLGSFVMLAVSDTGVGMDAETQRHIFEPFFTTKGIGQGTGLGLATIYGIVKQSNGYVRVSSEPGRGARFEIYLPRVGEQAVEGNP